MPCDRARLRCDDSLKYNGVGEGSSKLVQLTLVNTLDLGAGECD
jgi:hypothetical protein